MNTQSQGVPVQTATDLEIQQRNFDQTKQLSLEKEGIRDPTTLELQMLELDICRLSNGYQQLGRLHAELLLDQPKVWREYLLEQVYAKTLHPDICEDVNSFLEYAVRFRTLKGASL